MAKFRKKKSWLESVPVLLLLGLLAGAVGGVGIGLIQLRGHVAGIVSQQQQVNLPTRN